MTSAADRTTKFTRTDYMRLPEGFPAELIEGEFVKEPSPTRWHQSVVLTLASRLLRVVEARRVVISPVDVFIDDWNVLQPDVLVTAPEDRVTRESPAGATPVLAVEVLSPSTVRRDREWKTAIYLRAGVREVWLVDPDGGTIEVHTKDRVRRHAADEHAESDVVAGFRVSWNELAAG